MLDRNINTVTFLIVGIFSIVIGGIILGSNPSILSLFIFLAGLIFFSRGIIRFFSTLFSKNVKKTIPILLSIFDIIFGMFFIHYHHFVLLSTARIFALYLFLIAITHLINYLIYLRANIKGRLISMVKFLILLSLSLSLLFNPFINLKYLCFILGIYLILYGINSLTNFLSEVIPPSSKNKIKRSINIQLPMVLTAFIPRKLIGMINELLEEEVEFSNDYSLQNNSSNLEVLIHLAHNGSASMGHVEVAFLGKVYSYGNYNRHSRTLWDAVGDGIILIADKEKYINYCVEHKNRYIIEFGILLNEVEKETIKERIDHLISHNTTDYFCDLQLAEQGKIKLEHFRDMSSEIYKLADGRFKKITSGKYKKFFVLKNNCVMVAQEILSSVGKEILAINGIISPGAYYEYLNKRFLMKNTNVISRKIYYKRKK